MSKQQFSVATPDDFLPVITVVLDQSDKESTVATVVTLTGDLGAGKTTFTQQLAKYLGVSESVVSPTFGIMKGYALEGNEYFDQLVHIDAYRIDDISEAGPLRFAELFTQARTLVCIEWPERIAPILPTPRIAVDITIANNEEREVTLEKVG